MITGRVLDLYHRRWDGRALTANEFVISADEKTEIPIRRNQFRLFAQQRTSLARM